MVQTAFNNLSRCTNCNFVAVLRNVDTIVLYVAIATHIDNREMHIDARVNNEYFTYY